MNAGDPNAKVRADIKQYGWHCLHVWPLVGEDRSGFSYTIGLTESYDHPEIMVFGLGEKAHGILTECTTLIKGGIRFVKDELQSDILASDYQAIFKPVRKECFNEYLGTACRYYGNRSFDAFVLFWPNKEHQYPWESSKGSVQDEGLNVV